MGPGNSWGLLGWMRQVRLPGACIRSPRASGERPTPRTRAGGGTGLKGSGEMLDEVQARGVPWTCAEGTPPLGAPLALVTEG